MNSNKIRYVFGFFVTFGLLGWVKSYSQTLQDYEIQIRDLERFGNSYFAAYTNLFSSNFGFSLNQGWSGGKIARKAGHLSFSLVGSSAIIPINNENRFIVTNQLYQSAGVSTSPLTPGMFTNAKGGKISFFLLDPSTGNRMVDPRDGKYLSADFNMLEGLGTDVGVTPFAMPQVSVSLGKSTEVILRVLPFDIGSDDGKIDISAYGGAIRHNLSQWFTTVEDPAFSVNLLLSYMQNKVHFTPNGDRFLTFNNDFFNTAGSNVDLSYKTHTQQVLLFFNYKLSNFIQVYAHGGLANQSSNLGSDGIFHLNINNDYINDALEGEDESLTLPNIFNSRFKKTVPEGGAGIQFGTGVFQAEMQYTYANTHIASLGLSVNLFRSKK